MKTKRIILSLLVTIALVFSLTGCWIFENEDTITMVNAPKTEYAKGSDEKLSFTVEVVVKESTYTLTYEGTDTDDLKVTGFDLSTVGERTATITYLKAENLQLTFTYTVTDATADLEGEGTVASPYVLTSASDFATLAGKANFGTANITLGNDITFDAASSKAYSEKLYGTNFVGTFDGQSYTISNYTPVALGGDAEGEQAQAGLFYQIAPAKGQTATIKNLKLAHCSIINAYAAGAGLLGQGGYALTEAQGDVVIDNVDMFGCKVQGMKNSSLYLGYAAGKNVYFRNCDADANCFALTTGHSVATFVGSANYINFTKDGEGKLSFDNCTSAAKLVGNFNVRGFSGNQSMNGSYVPERINGCKYTGAIYTRREAKDSQATIAYKPADAQETLYLANTSLDNYTIHCAGVVTTGTGFNAVQDIKAGTLTVGTAGTALSIDNVEGGVTYIFGYDFARGNSTYGASFSAASGDANTEIKWFNAIYDYVFEKYDDVEDATALKVTGALSKLDADTYSNWVVCNADETIKTQRSVTFTVMVLDKDQNMIACYTASVKAENIKVYTDLSK